ncbi:hypothetical protein E4T56_gene8221 [Termitomyces sp. T112]|nr:hypothetical protein E4T56_gene8221 [Termitomyces sp. T112]KAH0590116.1 hypothetical protein H2248_000293 [Termitomyces sp. 'cryptogamus']
MVGSVGALLWDVLIHVDSDYKLRFKHKISRPTMVYFLSRVGVLVDVLMNVIFQTAALPNCQVIGKTVRIIYHIAFSSTAFLFFLRVRAVLSKTNLLWHFSQFCG